MWLGSNWPDLLTNLDLERTRVLEGAPHACAFESSQAVTADPRVGRVIAVAGSRVWEWEKATWRAMSSKVPSLGDVTAAYDPAIGDVIVWGMQTIGPHPRPVTWAWTGKGPIAIPTS
jgi:hypothetical protein